VDGDLQRNRFGKLIFFLLISALGPFVLLRGMQIFVSTEVVNFAYIYLLVVSLYRR
jgi:hypothetical protein